ncbi:hypothetical protein JHD50_11570 [Sulfurimonas sp. MAG313]|nr:hypothetical protein [Sulfurimonas sp. MAG313]MDF1881927.1 hypothetical protein [Sulfurimonas sp. MAG313]
MTNTNETSQTEQKLYEVITYEDKVVFNYKLPENGEAASLEHDLTFVWEDTIAKFIEEHGVDKEYTVHTFKQKRAKEIYLEQVEGRTDDLIEEVQEEIANKMKFGFEFTGQLHNDD